MTITNIRQKVTQKNITLTADIQFQGKRVQKMFFSVPKAFHSYTITDASPFLAALLLPCMKKGENITIEASVSKQLLENTKHIISLVESWNIGLKKISITTKKSSKDTFTPHHTGSFFSAGVDSFYTYLKHRRGKKNGINHLILVHGFDIPLSNTPFFNEVAKTVEQIAQKEHITQIFVTTNVKEIIETILPWDFSHGGALAAVALFLRKRLKTVYIPAAVRNDQLFPYGIHPKLDPLWGTEKLSIIHDGSEYNRLEKVVNMVGKSSLALTFLRVCTQNFKGEYNCSRCFKCLHTMIELTCAGNLKKAKTFKTPIDLFLVEKMYYDYSLLYNKIGEEPLRFLRKQKKEKALQQAIKTSLENSKKLSLPQKITQSVAHFDQRFNNRRLYKWVFALNSSQDRSIFFKFLLSKGFLK